MKISSIILTLTACSPISKPVQNYAVQYALAISPEADITAVGKSSAIGRDGDVVFFCTTDAQRRTHCGALADWRPKQPAPQIPAQVSPPPPPPPPPPATVVSSPKTESIELKSVKTEKIDTKNKK